jgi:uncharacterized protein YndB with AHSA1/START domain
VKPELPRLAVLVSVLCAASANAQVTASTANGFISEHDIAIAAPPQRVFDALTAEVGRWWDAAHSYSGNAANFTLDARAGGCFCERWSGGSIRHMTVVFVEPGHTLRLTGGLGPLQSMAVTGSMTFTLDGDGAATRLHYRYAVSGWAPDGLTPLAEPVDRVQLGQLLRMKRYVETGSPVDATARN